MPFMINRFTGFLSILFAISAVACSTTQTQAPRDPVSGLETKPIKPAQTPYTVELSRGWELVNSTPLEGDEPMLIAIYENEAGDATLTAGVVGVNLTAQQAKTFYGSLRDEAHESDTLRIAKERMVRLDGVPAYEFAGIEMMSGEPMAVIGLAITNGKVGYFVKCAGPVEAARFVVPTCAEFVESLRVAK